MRSEPCVFWARYDPTIPHAGVQYLEIQQTNSEMTERRENARGVWPARLDIWMNTEWVGNLQSDYTAGVIVVIIGLLALPCSTEAWY